MKYSKIKRQKIRERKLQRIKTRNKFKRSYLKFCISYFKNIIGLNLLSNTNNYPRSTVNYLDKK